MLEAGKCRRALFPTVVFVVTAIILSIIKDHNHSSNDIYVEMVRLHPWILQWGVSLCLQPAGWSDPQLSNSEGRSRRGRRQQCCAARRPCTAGYPGTMAQPWCASTMGPGHLSLRHHQDPYVQRQAFLQHPTLIKPGAECMGRRLGKCQGEVFLSTLSHHLANASPCPCLLQNTSVSVLAPLYSAFCLDNRCSSSCSCPGLYADSSPPCAPH